MLTGYLQVKLLLMIYIIHKAHCDDYTVVIKNNGPVISGAAITFNVTLLAGDVPDVGSFRFEWEDNSMSQHRRSHETDSPHDEWTIEYPTKNPPGPYIIQVSVKKYFFFHYRYIASNRLEFHLTEQLNGEMVLTQVNKTVDRKFVSNDTSVVHSIQLHKPDSDFLNKSATQVLTYWFIDCQYEGPTDNYEFVMNYTEAGSRHKVEALVVANFEPLPPPEPPTTTTTTTTPKPTTTTTTTTTTTPTTTTTTTPGNPFPVTKNVKKREVNYGNGTELVATVNGTFFPLNGSTAYNESMEFICSNNTIIPLGPNTTYGYFSKNIIVKEPVWNVTGSGNNWLQHGEMLNLLITCKGSSTFRYCFTFKEGRYNVTGNETCLQMDYSEKCHFPINWLFIKGDVEVYTAVVIIENDVSKVVYQNVITIYKVTKQAQLSVIVVPVVFSLVSVVLVIFGLAYYIQNRSRFVVEIADFNFGQQCGDMEYKTFRERLRDSFANAFTRVPAPGSSEGPIWPPGNKYGSMT